MDYMLMRVFVRKLTIEFEQLLLFFFFFFSYAKFLYIFLRFTMYEKMILSYFEKLLNGGLENKNFRKTIAFKSLAINASIIKIEVCTYSRMTLFVLNKAKMTCDRLKMQNSYFYIFSWFHIRQSLRTWKYLLNGDKHYITYLSKTLHLFNKKCFILWEILKTWSIFKTGERDIFRLSKILTIIEFWIGIDIVISLA